MAARLARSTPDGAVRVRALAGDIAFLGKTLHSLSTQVYRWVLANLKLGVTLRLASHPGGE